jgi:hypothetical protein
MKGGVTDRRTGGTIMERHSRLAVLLPSFVVLVVAVGGAGAAVGLTPSRVASAFDTTPSTVENTSDTEGLASAVTRWNNEYLQKGPGEPVLSKTENLLADVGSAHDTLTAFPTTKDRVCYHVLGAGSCGRLDMPNGITFSILFVRNSGTRLYGVAADKVSRVQVVVDGVAHDATLRNNGFYFEVAKAGDDGKVDRVISTFNDGTTHTMDVPG